MTDPVLADRWEEIPDKDMKSISQPFLPGQDQKRIAEIVALEPFIWELLFFFFFLLFAPHVPGRH